MKQVVLFFGSFNPIHIGHLILANYVLEHLSFDELWFVVTPHNPFKQKKTLLDNQNRLHMVELALRHYPRMRASNVEFSLPQPNYTIDTLTYLQEKYPNHRFSLLMGEDNLAGLPKWKNAGVLMARYPLIVYPRLQENHQPYRLEPLAGAVITRVEAPVIELSSTQIRQMLSAGQNVRPMLPPEVFQFLDGSSFYRN